MRFLGAQPDTIENPSVAENRHGGYCLAGQYEPEGWEKSISGASA
jgi:hypothetical protein